jgi:hypothetical protein
MSEREIVVVSEERPAEGMRDQEHLTEGMPFAGRVKIRHHMSRSKEYVGQGSRETASSSPET